MKKIFFIALMSFLVFSCKAEDAAKGGDFLAKVGGAVITEKDLNEEMMNLPQSYKDVFVTEEGLKMLLDDLVVRELLFMEAKKKGIDKGKEYESAVGDFKKRTLVRLLLDQAVKDTGKVTDKEAEDYYNKNKEQFVIPSPDNKSRAAIGFEEVKEVLKQRLVFESYIDSLKKSYSIEMNDAAIKEFAGKHKDAEEQTAEPEDKPVEKPAEKPAEKP